MQGAQQAADSDYAFSESAVRQSRNHKQRDVLDELPEEQQGPAARSLLFVFRHLPANPV